MKGVGRGQAIGEGRALRLRTLMEKLCDRNAVIDEVAQLEHPYDTIACKTYHESIVDLEKALDSLKTNLGNLAILPLKSSKEERNKALREYLGNASKKESFQTELQDYQYFCRTKRNTSVNRQLLYLKQQILVLVGNDELADLILSESERNELLVA